MTDRDKSKRGLQKAHTAALPHRDYQLHRAEQAREYKMLETSVEMVHCALFLPFNAQRESLE